MSAQPMTSKQRVLTTFARREADRVPINYFSNPGIDGRLKAHYGLSPDDGEGLLRTLGVDFRGVGAPYTGPVLHLPIPGKNVDPVSGVRTRWVEHASGGYWDFCDFPLRDADVDEVAAWPMPSPDDFDYTSIIEQCKRHEGYAIAIGGAGLCDIINSAGRIRSQSQALMDLGEGNEAGLLYTSRRLVVELEITRRTLERAKGLIDFMWLGEDLGTQIGPMIGKRTFAKHILPQHKPFFDLAKAYGLPVMMHNCGSSSWAFDDFIAIGLTVADTLQPEAANTAPAYLKERYGDRLAFHGCISTAGPVAYGTVEETVANCRETLEIMMPGGGYCFAPTHCLQDNSPTENVVAMYETALKHGWYR